MLRSNSRHLVLTAKATWGECRVPPGSLDTLPRLHSPLQTDGGSSTKAYESRKSHGKKGDCEQSSLHTLLSSSPLACTVARPEQQTNAEELDKPALFKKKTKRELAKLQ